MKCELTIYAHVAIDPDYQIFCWCQSGLIKFHRVTVPTPALHGYYYEA